MLGLVLILKNFLVMKFGGTSMGSADRMKVAARIIAEAAAKRPVAVVVSAMSKVTDLLSRDPAASELGDRSAGGFRDRDAAKAPRRNLRALLPNSADAHSKTSPNSSVSSAASPMAC